MYLTQTIDLVSAEYFWRGHVDFLIDSHETLVMGVGPDRLEAIVF